MKNVLTCAASVVALLGAVAFAQSPMAPPPQAKPMAGAVKGGRLYAEERSMKATVESIDYDSRHVKLKMPDGGTVSFTAGPEIKRLNEIKQGDRVLIQYLESVALVLRAPGPGETPATSSSTVLIRGKGKHPAGEMVTTVDLIADVVKVDKKKHTVSLTGPEGDTLIVEVPPTVGNLQKIKVGDHLYVEYTQALAMSIMPAKAKAMAPAPAPTQAPAQN